MKRKDKIMIFIGILIALISIKNVYAADVSLKSTDTVTITREIPGVSNVDNTFSYTITEKDTNPESVTGLTNSFQIEMNSSTNNYTLSLNGLSFSKVGDYEFIITEISSSNEDAYPIDTSEKSFYVMVRNEMSENIPTGNLEATLVVKGDITFSSDPSTTNLIIDNVVKGNGADTNKYFTYTLNIVGNNGSEYEVDNSNNSNSSNPTKCDAGIDCIFYLKHGESITISSIIIGDEYSITQSEGDGYITTMQLGDAGSVVETTTLNNQTAANDNIVHIVNTKEIPTLTGVIISIFPYVLLIGIAMVGIYLTRKKIIVR